MQYWGFRHSLDSSHYPASASSPLVRFCQKLIVHMVIGCQICLLNISFGILPLHYVSTALKTWLKVSWCHKGASNLIFLVENKQIILTHSHWVVAGPNAVSLHSQWLCSNLVIFSLVAQKRCSFLSTCSKSEGLQKYCIDDINLTLAELHFLPRREDDFSFVVGTRSFPSNVVLCRWNGSSLLDHFKTLRFSSETEWKTEWKTETSAVSISFSFSMLPGQPQLTVHLWISPAWDVWSTRWAMLSPVFFL